MIPSVRVPGGGHVKHRQFNVVAVDRKSYSYWVGYSAFWWCPWSYNLRSLSPRLSIPKPQRQAQQRQLQMQSIAQVRANKRKNWKKRL